MASAHSQLYSKVDKKGDPKRKSLNENDETSSTGVTEKDKEKNENILMEKDQIMKTAAANEMQRHWNELEERNFTLEEILALEENTEVRFLFIFVFVLTSTFFTSF